MPDRQDHLSRALAFAFVVGGALGVFSHTSSQLPGAWRWIGNFGALWVTVAFFLGRFVRNIKVAAIASSLSLATAAVIHYVPFRMARHGASWHAFRWPVALWVVVGIALGAIFGALGAGHAQRRTGMSILAVAALEATFAAEAFVLWRSTHPRAVQVAVPIEIAMAIVLPLLLLGSWKTRMVTYAAATALAPLAILGIAAFMGVIHRVYPGI